MVAFGVLTQWVFYLVYFGFLAECTATGSIKITLKHTGERIEETVVPLVLKSDDYIDVIVYCNSCENLIKLACHYAKNSEQSYINKYLTKKENSYRHQVKTLRGMNAEWSCNVKLTEYQSHDFNFNVKFLERGLASFSVNDVSLTNKIVSNNGEGYTEVAHYSYIPGELAKITCIKKEKNIIQMILKKGDDHSVINTIWMANKSMTFYVRLSKNDQKGYIDCNVKDWENFLFTIRLQFNLIHGGDVGLTVNNLILNRRTNDYFYEYFQGERLIVTNSIVNEKCGHRNIKDISYVSNWNISFTAVENVNEASLSCPSKHPSFTLSLVPMPRYFDLTVSGLSSAKTLLRYQSNIYEYRIEYDNTIYDNLLLTCTSEIQVTDCAWKFNESQVIVSNDLDLRLEDKYALKARFTVLQNITYTNINCSCSTKGDANITTVVEIINHNPLIKVAAARKMTLLPPAATKHPKDTESSEVPVPDATKYSSLLRYFEISGIITATLIIVIAVTWIIVGIFMRKRRLSRTQAEDSNINYENLSANDGAMPPPRQWDTEPVYIDTTYSLPYLSKGDATPKNITPEQPYAESSHTEPNYSIPIKGEPSNEYANLAQETPGYSQVLPKHLRNDARYQQVLPNMSGDTYAQVMPKDKRPKPADSKYVNVFDNQRYANAATEPKPEYAEPAYCELYKKSK